MVRPITQADAVLAVYHEYGGRNYYERLLLAAWPEGHVVWSADRLDGGPPYYVNDVDPNTITAALTRFEEDGLFANARLSHISVGADHPHQVILLRSGKKRVKMSSMHEFVEDPTTVARSVGTYEPLEGRTRVDALADEPAWYLHFRLIWCETRHFLDGLIPASGELTAGEFVKEAGELFWKEP